ncbi:MAG: FAD-dependent oxidoreductase [Methylococcales bacterium]
MTDYDLVIIGCGIHGAGVAQAAAASGYTVLVLEKNSAPGLETSARSSKLIHGGLRYLEGLHFRLVRECLEERQILLQNAPELVKLVPFHIPIYQQTTRKSWQIFLGLSLYSFFSRVGFRIVPKNEWSSLDGLRTADLKSVFMYYDAQTNDTLLTNAVLKSAQSIGAECIVDAELMKATRQENQYNIIYKRQGQNITCTAQAIVNATGPWLNQVSKKISPAPDMPDIELIQGTHIVIPGTPERGMYYLEAPQDKRAVFVMPWQGNTLVGTTESPFTGDPSKVHPLDTELDYLLEVYNHYFQTDYKRDSIIEAFAGLRVLEKSTMRAFKRSRDVTFAMDDTEHPRVIAIYGGKLTSYRATGERTIKLLKDTLPLRERREDTRLLKL